MLAKAEIASTFRQHWRKGWGSASIDDLVFIQDLVATYSPSLFLEVGTASDLSGGFIANFMSDHNGRHLITIDHDNSFFGDPTKPNGFLIRDIYDGGEVHVDFKPFTTSKDVPDIGHRFEMCFIDANHQHPWPTLDLIAVFPYLVSGKLVILDDLDLFKKQNPVIGIGPKYLFDQFPSRLRLRSSQDDIGALRLEGMPVSEVESALADALLMPWTNVTRLTESQINDYSRIIKAHYSENLVNSFLLAVEKFEDSGRRAHFKDETVGIRT
ncbi:class I SAM-dependent methyltransferase [Cyanobium sp. CH-040]|uniref:class I SAM-dependent methyltransferase n=1 Tax=Cyanobium sp. CH-040 TaxID=2823708 RepID=UPI0020CCBEA2|nr:class I SAM-dependent methyltransferase [Cyanobium sp. CH-040]MCP9927987.1 class I SAM-dependent methyltransferase [Cyanobium sp. CH-040]